MKRNWIAQRRDELEISQEKLLARLELLGLDISRSSLSNWENDKFFPPLEDRQFRRSFAQALKLTIPELLSRAGYEIFEAYRSPDAIQAAEIVEDLPQDARELAMDYLHILRKRYAAKR